MAKKEKPINVPTAQVVPETDEKIFVMRMTKEQAQALNEGYAGIAMGLKMVLDIDPGAIQKVKLLSPLISQFSDRFHELDWCDAKDCKRK